jgi:phosphoribosyl 1,2-cyclic phosphodiesterase
MSMDGSAILTIWGAGGSAPAAGPERAVFGGETVCFGLSADAKDDDMPGPDLLVDLGSGARSAGRAIMARARTAGRPSSVAVLLSHLHLDHIIGAPFFGPFYAASGRVDVHCGLFEDPATLEARLKCLLAPPWFPVEPLSMGAARFHSFSPDVPFRAAGLTVTAAPLHHPGGCMGFRIEGRDWALAVIGDHEHGCPDSDAAALRLARGATAMIYDASYDDATYPMHKGWGHSTWRKGIELARAAGVRETLLHHHLPDHDDAALAAIDAKAQAADPSVRLARQGMRLRLSAAGPEFLV